MSKMLQADLRFMKSAYQVKLNYIGMLFMFVGGVIAVLTKESETKFIGIFFITLAVIIPIEIIYATIAGSTMIQTSKIYKKQMTLILPMLTTIFSIVGFLVSAWFYYFVTDYDSSNGGLDILGAAAIVSMALIYISICYKHYWIGTAVLLLASGIVGGLSAMVEEEGNLNNLKEQLDFGSALAIGVMVLIIGAICNFIFSGLLYRHDYSKMVLRKFIKKV